MIRTRPQTSNASSPLQEDDISTRNHPSKVVGDESFFSDKYIKFDEKFRISDLSPYFDNDNDGKTESKDNNN